MVVRSDLAPGAMIAQACHAATTFMVEHFEIGRKWLLESNYIIVLEIKNEEALSNLIERAKLQGIKFSAFREPDFDDELTALALQPGEISRKLCGNLKLALKKEG